MNRVKAEGIEEPLRVVSDLHLGHPRAMFESVGQLRPLLEGVRTVVFNGDTCELDHALWRNESERLLGKLATLCDEMGVHPVFLTGNHDYTISDRSWLELGGGTVMVTHGDLLIPEVVPWSYHYLFRKPEVRAVLRDRSGEDDTLEHHRQTVRMVEEVLTCGPDGEPSGRGLFRDQRALVLPERLVRILYGWLTMYEVAEQFVERYRPEAKVFIFGHFHRAGVRRKGSRIYCNTGAYMREAGRMVVDLDGGWLTARPVVRRGASLELESPAAVYRLPLPRGTGQGGMALS